MAALTETQVRDQLRLDPAALKLLVDMSHGKLPRNAASALGAIRERLAYSQSRPKQEIEHSGGVTVEVVTYGENP